MGGLKPPGPPAAARASCRCSLSPPPSPLLPFSPFSPFSPSLFAAIVLRIDSGGGDALASDLMWREIQELGKTKPVIASLSDVAASGGYYMVRHVICV